MMDAYCAECDLDRSNDESLTSTNRTPCSQCGETSLQFRRHCAVTASPTVSMSNSLRPRVQDRDWRIRWQQLERRLPDMVGRRQGPRSAEAIHAAVQEFFDFLGSAYHLKNALRYDSHISEDIVEQAITDSPVLALLADLVNLDKHRHLTRRLRSGAVPRIESVADISDNSGWKPVVAINHKGHLINGRDFAADAIHEWRVHLEGWDLL